MAAVTICSDYGATKNKVWHCFHCFLLYLPRSDWTRGHDLSLLKSFKPTFSLSSFTFIKRFFSSSSLSTTMVMSSAYLRLLIFLPAILIPACASSSPAFLMMYGNPLQCPCLENPRDGGAWWAAVYGVAQSWTRLKWLSSTLHIS